MISMQRSRPNTKVQEISAQLRAMAYERGPNAKLPTARELYTLLGTNASTLNDALHELEAQHIISRKQGSGIFVSPKLHRKTFCLLLFSRLFIAEASSPFWGILWAHFAQEMERRNALKQEYYSLHLMLEPAGGELDLPPDASLPEEALSQIVAQNVHGILAVGMQSRIYEWFCARNIPSISFAGLGSYVVQTDDTGSLDMALMSLLEQHCRAIGLWLPSTFPGEDPPHPQLQIWHDGLAANQLEHNMAFVRIGAPLFSDPDGRIRDYYQQGYRLAHDIFGQSASAKPDGLYIANDLMTSGALAAFEELGIRVGEDIQLVSHANVGSPILANIKATRHTLLEVDPALLVQTMFSLLEQVMAGHPPEERVTKVKSRLRQISG